jgi:hypothetical protein
MVAGTASVVLKQSPPRVAGTAAVIIMPKQSPPMVAGTAFIVLKPSPPMAAGTAGVVLVRTPPMVAGPAAALSCLPEKRLTAVWKAVDSLAWAGLGAWAWCGSQTCVHTTCAFSVHHCASTAPHCLVSA